MTGRNGSFSRKKRTLSSERAAGVDPRERRADAVKTRIETSATMTRNVVPQRGCSVVFVRAFSTVSASPAS